MFVSYESFLAYKKTITKLKKASYLSVTKHSNDGLARLSFLLGLAMYGSSEFLA